ncbi:MAG: hypothetical protein BroJett026_27690 [Betaproteobacteria bacterium]|nr:MAG: hypothetical protein BroJett026_27690 [Betaproteobacteria bacterium]
MPKRPRDPNAAAFSIVQEAVGNAPPVPKPLGKKLDSRKGGLKGGKTRMDALTAEERTRLAKKAAATRWKKPAPSDKDAG